MSSALPAGAILAGGRSRRMDGGDKALQHLAGKPMLQHVIDRIQPQVGELALVQERKTDTYDAFRLPLLEDPVPGSKGPLGGVLSAMRYFHDDFAWLLLAPCDAPFLPKNLGDQLMIRALALQSPLAVIQFGNEWQPTFSLWHRDLLGPLEHAVLDHGYAGLKQFMEDVRPAILDWTPDIADGFPEPFFNINDSSALSQAARWLDSGGQGSC